MRLPLLALALGLALVSACRREEGSALDAALKRGELIIATEPEFPPFEFKDKEGNYQGFDMDMARALAKDLGVKLRIEGMEFTTLITALSSRKVDLIVSGMTATEERATKVTFTDPYFSTGLCLLVGAKSGIEKAEDVDGHKVVVKMGTTGDIAARRLFKKSEITAFDTEGACALEVANGRADAFLYDQLSILQHHKNNPETTRAILKPLSHEPYAMAVRHGDNAFRDRINKFLKDWAADGRYEALRKKWLPDLADGEK